MKYINKSGNGKSGSKKFKSFDKSSKIGSAANAYQNNSGRKNVALKSRLTKINSKNPSLFSVIMKNSIFIKILIIGALSTIGILTCSFFLNKKNEILPAQANFYEYDLGGRNRQQIESLINEEINPKLLNLELTFIFDDRKLKIKASDFNFQVDTNDFFDAAKRTNFTNNESIKPKLKCDENALKRALETFSQTSKILPTPFSYDRNGEVVTVRAGHDGKTFNIEKNKKKIFDVFSNFENDAIIDAEYDLIKNNNKAIDFEKLKKSIECEPKNACLTCSNGRTVFEKDQEGVKLSSSEKQKIKDPNYGTYRLKAQILKPEITVASLKNKLKADPALNNPIASFSTSLRGRSANALHNIKTVAKALDGIVLLPGERLSFLTAKKKAGGTYKKAIVFDTTAPGGQREEEGGGICQVSTTLFGAAMRANLNIIQRYCHSYRVHYAEIGQDAAVNEGSKDFVIENNRNHAIKIMANTTASSVTTSICGNQKPSEKVEVSIESKVTAETPTYVNAQATQTVKQNGTIIKQKVYNSHYLVREKDIERAMAAEARKAKAAQEAEARKLEELKKAQEAEAIKAEELKKAQEAENKKTEELKRVQEAEAKKTEAIKAEELKKAQEAKKAEPAKTETKEVKAQKVELDLNQRSNNNASTSKPTDATPNAPTNAAKANDASQNTQQAALNPLNRAR